MRIFNIVFIVIFVLFAALQYNDPDPYIWMPIYLYGAVMCFYAAKGRYFPRLLYAGIVFYSLYATYLFCVNDGVMDWFQRHHGENIASEMKATQPWIEQTREFFGLLILIVALIMNLVRRPARVASASSTANA